MIAIDNSALISNTTGIGIPPVNLALFVPAATFVYSTGNITVTDATAITSPDTFAHGNVQIIDNEGTTLYGNITTGGGNTGAISVSSLNTAGPLTIKVTLASTLGVQCTGEVDYVLTTTTSGSVGYWEITASTN